MSRRTLLKDTAIGAAGVSTMGIADIASAASKKPAKKAHKAPTAQIRNFDMIEAFYANYPKKLAAVRTKLNRPLTLSEKILFTHLYDPEAVKEYKRGASYAEFRPDRAGTHDIGGPMAILQFMVSGKKRIALPAAMVCDLIIIIRFCFIRILTNIFQKIHQFHRYFRWIRSLCTQDNCLITILQ